MKNTDKFNFLKHIDPTPNKKYLKWISKVLENEEIPLSEFGHKLKEYYHLVESNKAIIRDIYRFKSFTELTDEIGKISNSDYELSLSEIKNDYDIILDNPDLTIFCPHTSQASYKLGCVYFPYNSWCTTGRYFADYYFNQGVTLYYIKIKSNDLKAKLNSAYCSEFNFEGIALAVAQTGKISQIVDLDDNRVYGNTIIEIIGL